MLRAISRGLSIESLRARLLWADAHRRKDRWPSFCYDDEEDKIDTKRFVELAKAYIARKEAAAQPETLDSSPTKPDTSGHRT